MNYFNSSQTPNEEEDDSGWIFSYADMMTLLLGFFVILYSFSKVDESKFDSFSKELNETFKGKSQAKSKETIISDSDRQVRALHMLASMLSLGTDISDVVDKVEDSYEDKKKQEKLVASVNDKVDKDGDFKLVDKTKKLDKGGNLVELILPIETIFLPGAFDVSKKAEKRLLQLGKKLKADYKLIEIEIVGHTDSTKPRYSVFKDNFTLSAARASSVAQIFIKSGIDRRKISVRGMADTQPLLPERSKSGKLLENNMKKNRRIHLLIRKTHEEVPVAH